MVQRTLDTRIIRDSPLIFLFSGFTSPSGLDLLSGSPVLKFGRFQLCAEAPCSPIYFSKPRWAGEMYICMHVCMYQFMLAFIGRTN